MASEVSTPAVPPRRVRKKQSLPLVVEGIASGMTYRQAAEHAGVGRATVDRWMREPRVLEMVRTRQQEEAAERARARRTHWEAGARVAGAALIQAAHLLESPSTPPFVRAQLILGLNRQFGPHEEPEPVKLDVEAIEADQTYADGFAAALEELSLVDRLDAIQALTQKMIENGTVRVSPAHRAAREERERREQQARERQERWEREGWTWNPETGAPGAAAEPGRG